MRTYPQLEALVGAVREMDHARAKGDDTRLAAARVEVACVELVYSTEMHKRLDTIRANLIVEEHFGRMEREARETP